MAKKGGWWPAGSPLAKRLVQTGGGPIYDLELAWGKKNNLEKSKITVMR